MKLVVLLAAAMLADACGPAPQPAPLPPSDGGEEELDAGRVTPAAVCAHLAALDCAEGKAPNCVSAFEHAQSTRLTDLKPADLMKAKDKAAVRKVGTVRCK